MAYFVRACQNMSPCLPFSNRLDIQTDTNWGTRTTTVVQSHKSWDNEWRKVVSVNGHEI